MSDAPDLLEQFQQTVDRRADHPAVEAVDAAWSFARLHARATQLAHSLRQRGVSTETCVGICMRRGVGELVAMLATLMAGGAYVPLVPTHPIVRLRHMIEDAQPKVLIVDPGSPLQHEPGVDKIVLDDLATFFEGLPTTPIEATYDPEQLAYVMFTSGSTGRPKGVEIPRGALASFLRSMAHTPGLGEDDRLLAITTTGFDISGLELLLPLWVGATTVIADLDTARDPNLLRRVLERGRITTVQATPATWTMLLQTGWRGDGRLRILCGGDSMSRALADRLLAAGSELWNLYGPTETTIWSSVERVTPGPDRITIGRPIDATRIDVVDAAQRSVAMGAEGEIVIAGRGLARGYRGRPDLTAERFVVVQTEDGPQRRYRTGDLGRQLPDGRFECIGRIDHQVKIRGFRIELTEVEAALRSVPGVDDVVTVADQAPDGDARLVAYWTGGARRTALVEAARSRLPAYMVPASYRHLGSMPLNAHGKVDRKRLPRTTGEIEAIGPTRHAETDMEARVAAVWRDILGLADVPTDQDFFTLGGTSLLAVEVVARLERELGVEIPLRTFYTEPTVVGLAQAIGDEPDADAPIVVELRRGKADRAPLFCLLGVSLYQGLASALATARRVVGIHVPIRYVPGHTEPPSLSEIATRYVEVVRAHQPHGPYHLLGLCFGGIVAFEVARRLEASGESVETVTVIDAVLPTAIRHNTGRRVAHYLGVLRQPREAPQAIGRFLRRRADRVSARLSQSLSLTGRAAHGGNSAVAPIELPVDGPVVQAEVDRFAARPGAVAGRLMIVRATAEELPAWLEVGADHGWGGRAPEVDVHDIAADHLGVLQDPHVWSLARFVDARMQS